MMVFLGAHQMCLETLHTPSRHRLSETKIKQATPKEKDYALGDGNGLQMRIRINVSKLWLLLHTHPVTKKRVPMGFGPYPEISLAQARRMAIEARELIGIGKAPKEHREAERYQQRAAAEHTLQKVAEAWSDLKKENVTTAYAEDIWRSLHVFPDIGQTPISKFTVPKVIDLLRHLETKGSLETVKRVSQRLNEIMTYAVNSGLIHANPLSGIRAVFKKLRKQNMAAPSPDELSELMVALANASINRITRALIEWQLHTMTRPIEAATTRWADIDLEKKTWTIPAERMKKRRPHTVPLTLSGTRYP